jgi:hypothetical protein
MVITDYLLPLYRFTDSPIYRFTALLFYRITGLPFRLRQGFSHSHPLAPDPGALQPLTSHLAPAAFAEAAAARLYHISR